jgi:YVTN family beta-propeller protein
MISSSLLFATKTSVIPYSGSPWDADNVSGADFLENIAAVFNVRRPVSQVTANVSMHASFTQPLAGGVVVDGNKMVTAPLLGNRITIIDIPLTGLPANSTDGTNSVGGGRRGGVVPGSRVVYVTPSTATTALRVTNFSGAGEPGNSTFGSFGSGADKWIGAVLAQNGKIYCIPHNASNVLVIDPTDDSSYTFGTVSSGGQKWWGGCLSPINGKIYAMPYDSDTVLVIDPATDTLSTIGPIPSVGATSARFAGCALGTNGKLHGIPYNASSVLAINTLNDTVSVFGSVGSDTAKWEGGALGTDGQIYAAPFDASSILVIDPLSESTQTFGTFTSGGGKWRTPSLVRTGQILMMPASASSPILVVGQGGYNITRNITQSRYLNKF